MTASTPSRAVISATRSRLRRMCPRKSLGGSSRSCNNHDPYRFQLAEVNKAVIDPLCDNLFVDEVSDTKRVKIEPY